jgi:arylsulfatase A
VSVKSVVRFVLSLLVIAAGQFSSASERPNIVVILADDFGVGDIQSHFPDNKIPTPHLDRLVKQGMSFTDAHSGSAVCSPTRYGLLTGRYSWRTRLQEWVIAAYEPPLIDAERLTLPGMLKSQGYQTACIGKWHLGWNWPGPQESRMAEPGNVLAKETWHFTKPVRGGPTDRGFDYFYGVDLPNLPPFTYLENDRVVTQPTAKYKLDPTQGVNLPGHSVGAPMAPGWRLDQILPDITARAVRYVHERAKDDKPFFLYFSQTSPHEPVSPSKAFKGKSGIAPIADFVMETDWSAGQVIKAIEDAGIADNTVVIFTADNGHSHYTGWQHLIKAGHRPSGPYRGHKGDIWEGGHRVPMVVRWPSRIAAGSSNNQLICLNDIFATCGELVEADIPPSAAEDSFSFLPLALALGRSKTGKRTNVVSHSVNGEFAYREGPWKIVYKLPTRNRDQARGKPAIVELYNLEIDIAEKDSVADRHPEIVKRLSTALQLLVDRGTSRLGPAQSNDTRVRFDTIQSARWAPAIK